MIHFKFNVIFHVVVMIGLNLKLAPVPCGTSIWPLSLTEGFKTFLKSFYFNVVRAYWFHDICACTLSKVSLAILKIGSRGLHVATSVVGK